MSLLLRLVQLIIREVIAHWQLRHPNVVALLGIHQSDDEGPPCMVLQFAEHASARQYLKTHPEPQHFLRVVSHYAIYYVPTPLLRVPRLRGF